MSDTPETDAAVICLHSKEWKPFGGIVVSDVCRRFERARNHGRNALTLIAEDCEAWLRSESDEPSAEFIRLVSKYAREQSSELSKALT
jgi:hypothetical protein